MSAVGARGLVHKPQFNGKQERGPLRGDLDLRCPRNGQQTGILPRFHQKPLNALKQVFGKVVKVVLPSPDTGQQGGSPQGGPDVHALSGKAVRTFFVESKMKFSTITLCVSMAIAPAAFSQSIQPDMVISASRVLQRAQDALPDVSIITRADIERSQARDVPTLLQNLVGMEVTQSGGMGGVASLFMRGAESRHALVLVDGLPMNNLNFNLAALEHLPLSGIERIEVVRGNVSSLYGSAALGGVVQIFTRQNTVKGPWLEANGQLGSNSFRSAQFSAGQTWASGFGVNASVENVQTEGFNAINALQRPGTNPDRDGYSRQSNAMNFSQVFESGRVGLMLRETRATVQYDSQWGPAIQADESKSTLRNVLLSASYKASPTLQWDFSMGQQADNLNAAVTEYPYFVNSQSKTSSLGAIWTIWPQNVLTSGYESTRQKIASDTEYKPTERSLDSWRLGYQGKFENQQWQLNVRRDHYSDFGDASTWYAGYAYFLTPALRIKASASTGFMAPTFNDLYYPWGGNPLLKPEKARSNEVGVQYTQTQWHARLTAFENRYTDLIDNDADWNRTNIAKAKNQGLELALAGHWHMPGWGVQQWRFSMTSQDPQNEINQQALARRAKSLAQAGLTQSFGYWDAGLQIRYIGARADNSQTLAAYSLMDLTASRALTPELRLNLRIENATNENYQSIYGYNMPKRGLFVGLRWAPVL
jgi:vitamin B12 transporter